IFGLPDGLPRDWGRDLDAAIALDVPHISLYGLTAEPGTGLGRGVAGGRIRMADEDSYADEYLQAHHRLVAAGYRHYEVSNFARPGFESRHNRAYWTGVPYLGFGNSAHSFLPPVRLGNLRDWGEYVKSVRAGRTPWSMRDLPSVGGLRLEGLWLGLRSDLGLPRSALPPAACRRAREWIRRGLAVPDPERVRLTASGWLVLDALALELDGILEAGAPG
ncbi:MAG: coproporphyrinogen III oxidase, partial [Gemmatimonadota bacterium]